MVIVEIKGKQYAVEKAGEAVTVDYIDQEPGTAFDGVKTLLYKSTDGQVSVGKPYLDSVVVSANVKESVREKKLRIVKYKPKSGILKRNGFRARKSVLTIDKIQVN